MPVELKGSQRRGTFAALGHVLNVALVVVAVRKSSFIRYNYRKAPRFIIRMLRAPERIAYDKMATFRWYTPGLDLL